MIQLLPHQIAVALYTQLILDKFKETDKRDREEREPLSAEQQRKYLLFALKLIRDSDITWKELQLRLSSVLDAKDISILIKDFHKLQDTEDLMQAMKAFERILDSSNKSQTAATEIQAGFVTRQSIIGVFLRKLVLEFKKMSFDTVITLRHSISEYLSCVPSNNESTMRTFFDSKLSVDMSSSDMSCMEESLLEGEKENISTTVTPRKPVLSSEDPPSSPTKERVLLSRNQVIRFITQQVRYVENYDTLALPPDKLQEKINEIRASYPDIKEVYYLSFMNYLRVAETHKAAISLQLYFDYKEFSGKVGEGEGSELERHQLKFKAFRYCALNLGVMHCHHGNYAQAMISLEECIQIAQQTNDQKCLNNAMFWLSIIKEETSAPGEGSSHLKAFVSDTAKKIMDTESNTNLQEIDYLGLLRYTQLQAFRGSIAPSKGLAIISQIVSDVKVSCCAQLTRSSLLDFYGFKDCALINCQVPLQNMIRHQGDSHKGEGSMIKSKLLSIALCQLACLLANRHMYAESKCILQFASNQFSVYSSYQKMLNLCELKIQFDYAVGIRDVAAVRETSQSVACIDKLEGKYMAAVLDLLLGNITSASKIANLLLESIQDGSYAASKTPVVKVKVLILTIEMKLLSGNLNGALNLIFQLIEFVRSSSLYGFQIDANICLVRCQLLLGLTQKARETLDKTLYQSMAFGTYYQKGLLFYLKGKCILEEAEGSEKETECNEMLRDAKEMLERSMGYFADTQLDTRKKDVIYLQAIVAHKMGDIQERNKLSTQFRTLHEKLEGFLSVMMF